MDSLKTLLQQLENNSIESLTPQILEVALRFMDTLYIQETFDLSDSTMLQLYAKGHEYYTLKDYEKAIAFFKFVTLLNPWIFEYWIAYAAVLQTIHKFEEALQAYSIAAILSPDDPLPHLEACYCYLFLGDLDNAQKALHSTLHYQAYFSVEIRNRYEQAQAFIAQALA